MKKYGRGTATNKAAGDGKKLLSLMRTSMDQKNSENEAGNSSVNLMSMINSKAADIINQNDRFKQYFSNEDSRIETPATLGAKYSSHF